MNDNGYTECEAIGSMQKSNVEKISNDTTQESRKSGIYGLRCQTTNKWYVGKTKNGFSKRWRRYERLTCKRQPKLFNALSKYGYDAFDKIVLEECYPIDDLLDNREKFWIRIFNSFHDGYNLTEGGSGDFGRTNKSKKLSESHKNRLRLSHMGKTHTDLTKQKMSLSAEKRWKSDSSIKLKARMALERTGVRKSIDQILKTSGTKNGMFGRHWITNGLNNSIVPKLNPIPIGWAEGRTVWPK